MSSRFVVLLGLTVLWVSCGTEKADNGSSTISLVLQKKPSTLDQIWMSSFSAPTQVSDLKCLAINVTGPGIGLLPGTTQGVGYTPYCRGVGITSSYAYLQDGQKLQVEVPNGPNRHIQLLGVDNAFNCFTNYTVRDFVSNGVADEFYYFDVGSAEIDLFSDAAVSINAHFNPEDPRRADVCGGNVRTPIRAAWRGTDGAAGFTGVTGPTGTTFPASSLSGVSALTDNELKILNQSEQGTVYVETHAGGVYARLDLAIDIQGLRVNDYSKIRVAIRGNGGSYGTACDNTTSVANTNFSIGVFNQSTSTWEYRTNNTTTTNHFVNNFLDTPNFASFRFVDVPLNSTSLDYLYMSLRSEMPGVTASTCSSLQIQNLGISALKK